MRSADLADSLWPQLAVEHRPRGVLIGHCLRSSTPGTSELSRHGVPRSRGLPVPGLGHDVRTSTVLRERPMARASSGRLGAVSDRWMSMRSRTGPVMRSR